MSKAAQHQSIRRDDFLRSSPAEKGAGFHPPHLPSFNDGADEEDEVDETIKLQPINIQVGTMRFNFLNRSGHFR